MNAFYIHEINKSTIFFLFNKSYLADGQGFKLRKSLNHFLSVLSRFKRQELRKYAIAYS